MMTSLHSKRLTWARTGLVTLALGGFCLAAEPSAADTGATEKTYDAYTAPSKKRQQNFDIPGVVQKLLVKEGDIVKAGDLLAHQNYAAEEAHLRSLELLASATALEIKAANLQLEKDKIDLARKEKLLANGAANLSELEEARVVVQIDALKVESAGNSAEKAKADIEEEKARIEQKKLVSKIDGIISEINTHEGELANNDTQHPTVTIVQNNPLFVEVNLPSELVTQLKAAGGKQEMQVQYVDEKDKSGWRKAAIHFIKPEGDKMTNTEHVQLEMPNPEGRSSGLLVVVRMPTGGAQSGAAAANR